MADGNSGGGMGILGVLVGALIVIGLVMFFMGGFGGRPAATGGGNTTVTVNPPASAPAAPKPATPAPAPAPAAPAAPKP